MTAMYDFIGDLSTKPYIVSFCTANRIYPLKTPKGTNNSIVYSQLYNNRTSYFTGSFGLYSMLLELNLFSMNYRLIDATVNSIIDSYHGFAGTLNNTNFQRIIIYNNTTDLQTINDKVFRYSFDMEFTY